MSDAGDILLAGLGLLTEVFGEEAGNLYLPGSSTAYPFTGLIPRQRRDPKANLRDDESIAMVIRSGDISTTPLADSRVVFTGETRSWHVLEAQPVSPGTGVVGWRLSLRQFENRRTA